MLNAIRRTLRVAFGYRFTDIVEDSPNRIGLKYGSVRTLFDRNVSTVMQNERLVALFDLIEQIELHQPSNQEGPRNWSITVRLKHERRVEVGKVTDEMDASIIAARISAVTHRPVVTRP